MKITVTGSTGFIGKHFHALSRHNGLHSLSLRDDAWKSYQPERGETVLYLAGLAHQKKSVPSESYFWVNCNLAVEICRKLKAAGGSHFIYLSSSKVFGEGHDSEKFFTIHTDPRPVDAYGKSKLAGEQALLQMQSPDFRVTVIRIPLVYGPGVKANFSSLLTMVRRLPVLPLGNTGNLRSYLYIENLIHGLDTFIDSPAGGLFLLSDPRPLSTTELIQIISRY
ncbi:MAG: NAD-dependent epimerase/dehydratase family protein, partial [Spirochaetia bacterium]|nr:NAD-dependent epimerase/dehydratase family protein [Spirochaetia bacterium]